MMKQSFKRILSFFLSLSLCAVFAIPAFAMEMTDRFVDDHGIVMQEIAIDPYSSADAERVILTYHIQPETAQMIRNYVLACTNGSEDIISMTLTIPAMTTGRNSSGTRTYTGYGNKTYYEETITTNYHSSIEEIGGGLWQNYATDTVSAIGEYVVDGALDYLTKGVWSISNLFTPSAVPSDHSVTHSAQLHETKTAKHTYVVEDGQYYFGSLVQRSTGYFQNFILDEAADRTVSGKDSVLSATQTPNYNSPDKKAYYGYVSSGWEETISGYEYNGVYFYSVSV